MSGQDEPGAKIAKDHIEHLITQARRDRPTTAATVRWLDALDDKTHGRLAALGLTDVRKICELPRHVLAFMENYIERRTDWKKPDNHRQVVNHLRTYLERYVPLNSLTQGDCEGWHRWMQGNDPGSGLAPNTAGQNVKRCKQMFRDAIKHGLVKENPFTDIKIDLSSNVKRNYLVSAEETQEILAACPDQEWRVIFVLSRYGGLRIPSEVLALTWSMIDWENDRFTFPSCKTERHGKIERTVPLFPEIAAELACLKEQVEIARGDRKSDHVISSYRDTTANLRKAYRRILDDAGVVQYEKPFMNNRSTRRNEMDQSGVRCAALDAWFGHDDTTAQKYYEQVTEHDYRSAIRGQSWGHVPEDTPTHRSDQDRSKPRNTVPERPGESRGGDGEYTWVDAFRTSLISNIDSIQNSQIES